MTAANGLIPELQRDQRFKATCPACVEDFALSDSVLFLLDAGPPPAALAPLSAMRTRIKQRKAAIRASREGMTKGARRTAEAVNLGMIVEKIVPRLRVSGTSGRLPGHLDDVEWKLREQQ